jgi:hypothetical protein
LANSESAPLESSCKNVTDPVVFPFAMVFTNSHGWGVCAEARKNPKKQPSTTKIQNVTARRLRVPPEGHGNIPNFLALNEWFSLFTRKEGNLQGD